MIKRVLLLIPKFWILWLKYLCTPIIRPIIPQGPKAYIFMAADYGNLGDVALTLAQKQLILKHFPTHKPIEVPASISLAEMKGYILSVSCGDVVTIIAGGNMGDVWSWFEMYRQLIVSKLDKYMIYQFPQTVTYTNSILGKNLLYSAKHTYSSDHLIMMAREKMSYDFMKDNFDCNSYLAPDVVMTLKYWGKHDREGLLLCLRDDREQLLSLKERNEINDVISKSGLPMSVIDTKVDNTFKYEMRYSQLDQFIDKVSSAKVIITDRLHGMIFAYITGTPAVVLPNSNRKIEMCYEWISNCGFISFCPSFSVFQFQKLLNLAMNSDVDYEVLESNYCKFNNIFNSILINE